MEDIVTAIIIVAFFLAVMIVSYVIDRRAGK